MNNAVMYVILCARLGACIVISVIELVGSRAVKLVLPRWRVLHYYVFTGRISARRSCKSCYRYYK